MRSLNMNGQSMVEMLVILQVMLLLILGAIQFALIYNAKITLNYATYEAARAGSLNNATFDAAKEGFARGLAPLYAYAKKGERQVDAFQVSREKILDEFDGNDNLICIERLSPVVADFSDGKEIPNDNLRFRSSQPNSVSNRSIQQANLLHLRVTYWYPLYVPMVGPIIKKVVCSLNRWSGSKVCSSDENRIPLTSIAAFRMQSPAQKSKYSNCK